MSAAAASAGPYEPADGHRQDATTVWLAGRQRTPNFLGRHETPRTGRMAEQPGPHHGGGYIAR